MRTLVVYYSYGGSTKRIAEVLAKELGADIAEVKDNKRPGKLKAYVAGCYAALRGKAWPIRPLDADMAAYDKLVLLAPIWAGHPAPPFHSVLAILPPGKLVEVKMVSMSGGSSCKAQVETAVKAKGCTLAGFEDIKSR